LSSDLAKGANSRKTPMSDADRYCLSLTKTSCALRTLRPDLASKGKTRIADRLFPTSMLELVPFPEWLVQVIVASAEGCSSERPPSLQSMTSRGRSAGFSYSRLWNFTDEAASSASWRR
jgi:hypothetical protein